MPLLPVVLRELASGDLLAEALNAPEVSALIPADQRSLPGLRERLRRVLERDAAVVLHRRFAAVENPVIRRLELNLQPPRREVAWEQPAVLRVHAVFWHEPGTPVLHHASVPGTDVRVMGTDATQVEKRVLDHLRLLLLRKDVGLRTLSMLPSADWCSLAWIELSPLRNSPRQLAEQEAGKEETVSVLAQVASEWTACRSSLPATFEMADQARQLAEALTGTDPMSVLLIGAPGVGKTALVRQLVHQRNELGLPVTPVWSTSAARLIAGQSGFGMWQERCRDLVRDAAAKHAILHLGNLWELMEVGKFKGNTQSIAAFLRPALARGELLAIAECTPEQFAVIERTEPALAAVFHPLHLSEPPAQITRVILGKFDRTSGPRYADSTAALDWMHRLHLRYATYSASPGRPLRFLRRLLQDIPVDAAIPVPAVTRAFARETGLPAVLLDDALTLDPAQTRDWFAARVLGQDAAVDAIVGLLATIKTQLTRPRQPLASLLFIGPTGTGKTELAKALAHFLFGNVNRLARFDLNEFSDPLSVQRLVGGPAVGSAEGLLTARVREHPFSVLLFDEFEKADPAFFDLLLQVLGDGRLTDASGRVADFCNTVIIMTSNLGARDFQRGSIGFSGDGKAALASQAAHFDGAVRAFLRPEIYNRLGGIVPFQPLSRDLAARVLERHLMLLRDRDGLRLDSVTLKLDAGVEAWLLERGFDERYGARPLKRVLERELMTPLAEAISQMAADDARGATAVASLSRNGQRISIAMKPRRLARAKKEIDAPEAQRADLARRAVALRRGADQLRRCQAVRDVENRLPLLVQHERRLRSRRKAAQLDDAALARLHSGKRLIESIENCCAEAGITEMRLVKALHRSEPVDPAVEDVALQALVDRLSRLRLDLFKESQGDHRDALIMLVADGPVWLQRMAEAYTAVAKTLDAELTALDYLVIPGGTRADRATRRQPAASLKPFLQDVPARCVGLLMRIQGDLVLPCFAEERGLHSFNVSGSPSTCLVEVVHGSQWKEFKVPPDAHRASFLSNKSVLRRRNILEDGRTVLDVRLGTRVIPGLHFSEELAALVQERFQNLIAELM